MAVCLSAASRAALALALLLASGVGALANDEAIERRVFDAIQSARAAAGRPPLERRAALDAAARSRAGLVAAEPQEQRLSLTRPIDVELQAAEAGPYRSATPYLVLKRGYDDYAEAFVAGWIEQAERWEQALAETTNAIGLAVRTASDGWVILFAILLEDTEIVALPQRVALERRTLLAVNETRREHGVSSLTEDPTLTRIARGHSEDMARRHYVAHFSPEGFAAADRVRRHAVRWVKLGENIHKSRGVADPARTAVESWLASAGHRKTMLHPGYTRTGVGVAIAETGEVYFTQLFVQSPD